MQGCQITWTYFDKIIFNIVHKCKSQLGKKQQQQQQHMCTCWYDGHLWTSMRFPKHMNWLNYPGVLTSEISFFSYFESSSTDGSKSLCPEVLYVIWLPLQRSFLRVKTDSVAGWRTTLTTTCIRWRTASCTNTQSPLRPQSTIRATITAQDGEARVL